MPGLSALLPIQHIADAKPGEVAFVSGAAGAVGSIAGQLLKLKGLKVYGSAGYVRFDRFSSGMTFFVC